MSVHKVTCEYCSKDFNKSSSAYNRSVKKCNKHYCSISCSKEGRKSKVRKCHFCTAWTKAGNKFCSKLCYNNWQRNQPKRNRLLEGVKQTQVKCLLDSCANNVIKRYNTLQKFCSLHCASIYRAESLKQATFLKSPLCLLCAKHTGNKNKKFCNNECWSKYRRKNSFNVDYRVYAFNHLPNKCADCKIETLDVLEVHHIDQNRSNNDLSNLLILCANCHLIRHKGIKIRQKCQNY
jgi:predicted nucleic acid-binding Zn ribbon protein